MYAAYFPDLACAIGWLCCWASFHIWVLCFVVLLGVVLLGVVLLGARLCEMCLDCGRYVSEIFVIL